MAAENVQNISAHGWKTYLAGGSAIVGGATLILVNNQYETGIAAIVGGLTILGIGGKAAKIIQLLQALAAKRP